jgi:hypothetical protein
MDYDHSRGEISIVLGGPTTAGSAVLLLVRDYAHEVGRALGGIDRQSFGKSADLYVYDMLKRLVRWFEGYVALSQQDNRAAAQLLVRPMFEAVFKIGAVRKEPALLYGILCKENIDEQKYISGTSRETKALDLEAKKRQWDDFKQRYQEANLKLTAAPTSISVFDLSEKAGLTDLYNGSYRPFSQSTHASYSAISGIFDDIPECLDFAVCRCAWACVDALAELGASSSGFGDLKRRHVEIATSCFGKQTADA